MLIGRNLGVRGGTRGLHVAFLASNAETGIRSTSEGWNETLSCMLLRAFNLGVRVAIGETLLMR